MLRFLFLLVSAVFILTSPRPAAALDLTPGVEGLCLYTLSGTVQNGDLSKLTELNPDVPRDWPNFEDGHWKTLCLDSPGGSFTEAFRIAQFLLDNHYGTVINDSAQCLSACSMMFMFGTAYQHESNALTHRKLHVRGKLGFHQPALPLDPNRDYSIADVEKAFEIAIESTLRFLALAARPRPDTTRPFIDSDLQEAMLQHKGQSFFMIDTVNKAGRWDIDLFGFESPVFDERTFVNACQNMVTWPARLAEDQTPWERGSYSYGLETRPWMVNGQSHNLMNLQFAGMQTYDCSAVVAQHWTGDVRPMLCGYRENTNVTTGPDNCHDESQIYAWSSIPAMALFPAATTLTDLASGAAMPQPLATSAPVDNPCVSETQQARVINVQNYTSLRKSTGHDTDKIDELPLGSTYSISRSATVDPLYAGHSTCSQLCQQARKEQPYDDNALAQCIDDNWMWFKIQGPSGRWGYASAKYLEY